LATASRPPWYAKRLSGGFNAAMSGLDEEHRLLEQFDLDPEDVAQSDEATIARFREQLEAEGKPEEESEEDWFVRLEREVKENLIQDEELLAAYADYKQKFNAWYTIKADIDEYIDNLTPDQQSFIQHFIEFVKPAEAEPQQEQDLSLEKKEPEEKPISFQFAPGEVQQVGSVFPISAEDVKRFLPEGLPGQGKFTSFKFGDNSLLLRPVAYELIQELVRRQELGFLPSAGNESLIFSGDGGSGKSMLLAQLVLWARKNNWFVVWIPDGRAWTGVEDISPSLIEHGHYDQIEKAARFAARLNVTHGDKLKTIKIKGDFEIEGFHRKADSTLFDLLEYAYKNDTYAVNVIYNFRRELNRMTEFPILIAIDRYNFLWDKSAYFDPGDYNRGNLRKLPSQKLMLTKLFSNHQDHGLVNGTMVCALQTTKPSTIKPFLASCGERHLYHIPPYTLREFHKVMKHYKEVNFIDPSTTTKATEQFIYQICSGLPGQIFQYCTFQ